MGGMTVVSSSHGSLAAVLGWGIGLVIAGATIVVAAVAFLADYRGVARNYYESIVATRGRIPGLGRRYERSSADNFRIWIGIGFIFLGIVIMFVGILGLARA
jgi:hypothetical protein